MANLSRDLQQYTQAQNAANCYQQLPSMGIAYTLGAGDSNPVPSDDERFGCITFAGGCTRISWWATEEEATKKARELAQEGKPAHIVKRVALAEPAAKVKKL